jgi:hypothetical protein
MSDEVVDSMIHCIAKPRTNARDFDTLYHLLGKLFQHPPPSSPNFASLASHRPRHPTHPKPSSNSTTGTTATPARH